MSRKHPSAAPIAAAIALGLLILAMYIGSYWALAIPNGEIGTVTARYYHFAEDYAEVFFSPLERLDPRLTDSNRHWRSLRRGTFNDGRPIGLPSGPLPRSVAK